MSRTLSPRTYRLVDRVTKLAGVALVAGGLEAGGASATGLTLGAIGTALAVTTVFLSPTNE